MRPTFSSGSAKKLPTSMAMSSQPVYLETGYIPSDNLSESVA